jgi:elongator complex protein 5
MVGRLIIIDSIHPLLNPRRPDGPVYLPTYLSSFITTASPTAPQVHISLVVTYHRDIPSPSGLQPYSPSPLSILTYLATTIFTLHPLSQILVQKAARDRSQAAPIFGLEEQQDGLIVGQLAKTKGQEGLDGIVLEMEHRRRSGRYVVECYILPPAIRYHPQQAKEVVTLLDDHPLYCRLDESGERVEDEITSTFELRLTERQRREREGVVLPYFDAQQGNGPGEGGRILYDMGEEDDFDDEEDEI